MVYMYVFGGLCLKNLYSAVNVEINKDWRNTVWLTDNMSSVREDRVRHYGTLRSPCGRLRKVATTDSGLVIEVEREIYLAHGDELIDVKVNGLDFRALSPDGLISSLERGEVFSVETGESHARWVRQFTTAALAAAKAAEELAKEEAVKAQLLRREVAAGGKEKLLEFVASPDSVEAKLFKEILDFDVYYDYSDDHRYCISYRAYERDLRARLAKSSLGEEALRRHIAHTVARNSK